MGSILLAPEYTPFGSAQSFGEDGALHAGRYRRCSRRPETSLAPGYEFATSPG